MIMGASNQPNVTRNDSFLVLHDFNDGQDYQEWYGIESRHVPVTEVRCHHSSLSDQTESQMTSTNEGDMNQPGFFECRVFRSIDNACNGVCADQARDDNTLVSLSSPYSFAAHTLTDGEDTFVSFYQKVSTQTN
jgi:hypothetical protein